MNFIVILTILNSFSLTVGGSTTIKLLQDFCQSKPSHVKAYTCWEKADRSIIRSVYKINALTSVEEIDHVNIYVNTSTYSVAISYIVNIDCPNASTILQMANKNKLFRPPNRWLLLTKSNISEINISKTFGDLDFFLDTTIIIAIRIAKPQGESVSLTEIYKKGVQEPLIFNHLGYWSPENSLLFFQYPSSLKRKNLNGLKIPAVIVVAKNESLNLLDDLRDKHIDTVSKYSYVLVNQAMDFMNSSAKYMVEYTWGYKINGTYNGMVGKLHEGKAEITATALFLTTERVSILEYVSMTTPTRFRFVFRQPKLSSVRNIFLLPFTTSVWASLCGTLFITAFLLYHAVKNENKFGKVCVDKRIKRIYRQKCLRLSWGDAVLLTFGASCQQGFFADVHGVAGRLVTIVLYGTVILMHTSYSANIVALIQSSGSVIQTISDLLNSPMKVGVDDTVYNRYFFALPSQDPAKNQLYQKKIAPLGKRPAFYPMEEGIERVRKGLFAFHVELGSGYKLIKETFATEEKCDLHEIPFLQPSGAWIAIRKHSPYSKAVKVAFRKIQESGLQNREYFRWFTKKPKCEGRQSSFVQVGLMDIWVAVFALGAGIAIAVGIFVLEIIISLRRGK